MNTLTKELIEHFKAETAWRPGLGLWLGNTEQRLYAIETSIKDLERVVTMLVVTKLGERINKLEQRFEERINNLEKAEEKKGRPQKEPKRPSEPSDGDVNE